MKKDTLLKTLPFYRWHPEVAIRYLPIVEEIKRIGDEATVLEVGSGGLGVAPYLGRELTGVDSDFSGPKHPLLRVVQGVGEKLPFADKSFDVVISVDTLEHVPPQSRQKVLSEMVRVARKEIIVAFPSGEESLNQDRKLSEIYRNKFGEEFLFLKEHLEYGLPDEQDVLTTLKGLTGPKAKIRVEGNENLDLRRFLMTGWMTENILVNIFFRKVLLLTTHLFVRYQKPPFYRMLIYAKIKH